MLDFAVFCDGKQVMGILTDKDIFKFISKNESVALSFVSEQTIGRDVAERFNPPA